MFFYQQTSESSKYFVSIILRAYSKPSLRRQDRKEVFRVYIKVSAPCGVAVRRRVE